MEDNKASPELQEAVQGLQEDFAKERAEAELEAFASGDKKPVTKMLKGQEIFPRYTPRAMVQLIIENPDWSFKQFAAYFGQKESWFSAVLVSPRFQAALEPYRDDVQNPAIAGTLDDLFRALTLQSATVLMKRLDDPKTPADVAIEAAKIGIKALGMGTNGPLQPPTQAPQTLSDLAKNLLGNAPAPAEGPVPTDYTIDATLREVPEPVAAPKDTAA